MGQGFIPHRNAFFNFRTHLPLMQLVRIAGPLTCFLRERYVSESCSASSATSQFVYPSASARLFWCIYVTPLILYETVDKATSA